MVVYLHTGFDCKKNSTSIIKGWERGGISVCQGGKMRKKDRPNGFVRFIKGVQLSPNIKLENLKKE
jgi:hypothetical protein